MISKYTELINSGLHVFPVFMPSKAPDTGGLSWKIKRHYQFGDNIAMACGSLSGGIEVIDIDCKNDPSILDAFLKAAETYNVEVPENIVVQRTINGGFHYIYRLHGQVHGNRVLARATDRKVLIETRGEGGYIVIAPTPGYSIVNGELHDIPTLTQEQHEALISAARSLNQYFTDEKKSAKDFGTPWQEFNEAGDIRPILEKHGWAFKYKKDLNEYYCRPGKTSGVSASYHVEKKLFYVFTSSTGFEPDQAYNNTAVLATLEYGGDFKLTARELIKQGYGKKQIEYSEELKQKETLSIPAWIELIQACYCAPFLPIKMPWINDELHNVAFSVLACGESGSSKGLISTAVTALENITDIVQDEIRTAWLDRALASGKFKKPEDAHKAAMELYFPLHMTFEGSVAGMIKAFNTFADTGVITIAELDQLLESHRKDYNADVFSILRKMLEGETFSKYLVAGPPVKMLSPNIGCMFTGAPVLIEKFVTKKHIESGTISRFLLVNVPDRNENTSINYNLPLEVRGLVNDIRGEKRKIIIPQELLKKIFDLGCQLKGEYDSWAPRVLRNACKFIAVKNFINERRIIFSQPDLNEALEFAIMSLNNVYTYEQDQTDFRGQAAADQAVINSQARFKTAHGLAISERVVEEIKRLGEAGLSKSEIARRLKLSRTTVNKYLS